MRAGLSILLTLAGITSCGAALRPYPPVNHACRADRIGRVVIEGAPREALAPLTVLEGTHDDPPRTARIAALATETLRARGYATATLAITRAPSCGIELHVAVALGRRFQIARIEFQTEDAFPEAERLATIADALGTVNAIGGSYLPGRLGRALVELRRRYRDAGWLDAAIDPPEATLSADGLVTIAIPVRAGTRFKIGTIRAIGTSPSTRSAVVDALGLRPGDYYDRRSMRAGIERARRQTDRWIDLHVEIAPERAEIDVEAIVEAP